MTERTITVKQARAKKEEITAVFDFLRDMESLVEDGSIYDDDGVTPISPTEDHDFADIVCERWRTIDASWSRVMGTLLTMYGNCIDLESDVVEWKPEVQESLNMVQRVAELPEFPASYAIADLREDAKKLAERLGDG